MKINIIARVCMEPKFWFRPEVPISNHLNFDNILRFFDILNCLFHEWLRIESLHYFHSLFRGSKSIPKCTKQEFSASCIKLGSPKEESKIHKWHLLFEFLSDSNEIFRDDSCHLHCCFDIKIDKNKCFAHAQWKCNVLGLFIPRFPSNWESKSRSNNWCIFNVQNQ